MIKKLLINRIKKVPILSTVNKVNNRKSILKIPKKIKTQHQKVNITSFRSYSNTTIGNLEIITFSRERN